MLATDCRLCDTAYRAQRIAYRSPMKFGGRVVTEVTLFDVRVEVETRAGARGIGYGSMPLGNVWAWPSSTCNADQTLTAMRLTGERFGDRLGDSARCDAEPHEYAHPLQWATRWEPVREQIAREIVAEMNLAEPMPRLAELVATSPFEAALFDAYGKALGRNAYDLLSAEFIAQDLAAWLGAEFSGEHLDRYTRRQPQPVMPLYHLVGALDPLTHQDVAQPVGDGLPETLSDWIVADGLTHLKIKLNGDDLAWDVARVVAVEQVAASAQQTRGCHHWLYSLDFNEKCRDVTYVLAFLDELQRQSAAAFARVHYIEQPTHRDLHRFPENRMHAAAARKPVVIDESLVDLASLHLSREQGYSGVALKACKGHAEALLMGAAAQKFGLFLCVQDLTCPGASFLHSASLAARIPTVAAIEGNARQYCPAGNAAWTARYPTMFNITAGTVDTSVLTEPGLGFSWPTGERW